VNILSKTFDWNGVAGIRVIREFSSLIWNSATPFIKRRLLVTALLIVLAAISAGLGPLVLKAIVDGFESRTAGYTTPLFT
jgi:hypothetical protein